MKKLLLLLLCAPLIGFGQQTNVSTQNTDTIRFLLKTISINDIKTNVEYYQAMLSLIDNEIKNDSFTFTVSNGKESEKRQLNIQITGINNPPISMDRTIIHDNLTPYSFSINDFYFDDAESDILKYLILHTLHNKLQ